MSHVLLYLAAALAFAASAAAAPPPVACENGRCPVQSPQFRPVGAPAAAPVPVVSPQAGCYSGPRTVVRVAPVRSFVANVRDRLRVRCR